MARLDRLGSAAKEVAQIGAAIGREFSYELLIPVAQKSEKELKASLLRLSDAELVFAGARRRTRPSCQARARARRRLRHAVA